MNIADQINAVIRSLKSTGEGHSLILTQTFATTPEDLWDACTNPARLARWYEPVDGTLRQGGRYRLTDSGTVGSIEQCDPPSILRVTWEYADDISHVVITIVATESGTSLTAEHTMSDNEHWRTYGPSAPGVGWDVSFLALALHLAGDPRATPEVMASFSATSDGSHFEATTLAQWEQAHVAAGAAPDVARLAARRSAEFYASHHA